MSLKISRILHAGYVFEADSIQIAFDPIFENPFSKNCFAYPDVRFDHDQIKKINFDAVFISHFHDDHCSLESLALLNRKTPIYIYCVFEQIPALIRDLGFTEVYLLSLNESVQIGSIHVTARRALDQDVDSILQIKYQDLNVLNVVDSWIDYSTLDLLSKLGPWDLILWPFQTMREIQVLSPFRSHAAPEKLPPEWIDQLKMLKPKYIVPSSCQFIHEIWSWYRHSFFPVTYRQFEMEVHQAVPNTQVIRMNPSVSVILDRDGIKEASSLPWVQPVGEQNLDYHYNPDVTPPTTAELAKNFAPLSSDASERVFQYCRSEIIEKYKKLEISEDSYFDKPRTWRLMVYDHAGAFVIFQYDLHKNKIKLTQKEDVGLSWLTEVPISTFYGALADGESLSSMYIRINDFVFSHEIENEMRSVDILEDPLIRCLFSGEVGGYQKAQLLRLLSK